MNKRYTCTLLGAGFLGLMVTLSGCGAGRVSVTAAGSTAFQPFAEKLAEQFVAAQPEVNVTVQGGGSAVGVQSALSGAAQIGMADLVTLPEEAKALTSIVVAKDSIAVVVHPSSPVSNLTSEQVRGVFNGTITNWRDLGGGDHRITVTSREAGSGTRSSFEAILGDIRLTKDAIVQDSNGTVRETVANDSGAIGYLSHGLLNEKIKAVTLDGVECSVENIANGSYPLVRPVYFLTRGPPEGEVKAFIDYVLSDEAQATIQKAGLLPAK